MRARLSEADIPSVAEFPDISMSTLPPEFFRFLERAETVLARVESLLPKAPAAVKACA
jgi:hypothetical protein